MKKTAPLPTPPPYNTPRGLASKSEKRNMRKKLLHRPLLFSVKLLEGSRVNLIRKMRTLLLEGMHQVLQTKPYEDCQQSFEYLEDAGRPHLHSDASEAA